MYTYQAKLIRVIDGDMIDAEIDLGFDIFIRQRIKLYGINTAQSRDSNIEQKEKGIAAKSKLIELLDKEFIVQIILNKRGKYGRSMGIVFVKSDNNTLLNINDTMVEEGFATLHSNQNEE